MKKFATLLGGLDHRVGVRPRGGHRLFAQNVLAGRQCVDAHRRVCRVGPADHNGVNLRTSKHLLVIDIGLGSVLFGNLLHAIQNWIDHRSNFRIRISRRFGQVAMLRDRTATNDAISDRHENSSFGPFSFGDGEADFSLPAGTTGG